MFSYAKRVLLGQKQILLVVRNIGTATKWEVHRHPHTESSTRLWWSRDLPRAGDTLIFSADKRRTNVHTEVRVVVMDVRHYGDGRPPRIIADFASALPASGHDMKLCGFNWHRHNGDYLEITRHDRLQYGRHYLRTAA